MLFTLLVVAVATPVIALTAWIVIEAWRWDDWKGKMDE